LRAERWVRGLVIAALVLAVSGLIGQLLVLYTRDFLFRDAFAQLTDLNGETNLPATFSSLLLLIAALLLSFVASAQRKRSDQFARAWRVLAGVFYYLALDENAMFDERTMNIVRQIVPAHGLLHYSWVIPYGIAGIILLLFIRKLIWTLPPIIRLQFIIAGFCYVMGAMGMEMFEGLLSEHKGGELPMQLLIFVEELLEMLGVILFISAILRFIRTTLPAVSFKTVLDR